MRSLLNFRISGLLFLMLTSQVSFADGGEVSDCKFETLPVEMINAVMCELPLKSLANLMATNRDFSAVGGNDLRWKSSCIQIGLDRFNRTAFRPMNMSDEEFDNQFKTVIESIENISEDEIADLSWKELYLYLRQLDSTSEEFQKIEAASLPSKGIVSTLGGSLWEGSKHVAMGVPKLLLMGGAMQSLGTACMVLSVPMMWNPFISASMFGIGVGYITCGTLMEASACTLVPALSPLVGYQVYTEKRDEKISLARRNFKFDVWNELFERFDGKKIPAILVLYRQY
ncbi:MAG: hypothetical protein ABI041_02200 [Bdellovibrionia bacterium]